MLKQSHLGYQDLWPLNGLANEFMKCIAAAAAPTAAWFCKQLLAATASISKINP